MKSNKDLVKHVEMALAQKWGYVWGTFGMILTPTLFNQKLKQYPGGVGNHESFIRRTWLNRRTADCVGLIKSFIWWDGTNPRYNGSQDTSANGMYGRAKKKGPLSTIPEIPGICVWHKGHIGVYIGNGWVIEARGTTAGVIKSPLRGTGAARWSHWLECPFINYVATPKPSTSKPVETPKTEVVDVSLKQWQKDMGEKSLKSLVEKGIVNNPDTWMKSLGEETPQYLFWGIIDRITEKEGK